MKFRTFMTIYALVSILFGLGFVLVPGLVLSIYGVETDLAFRYIGQLFGAALISLAVLAWSSKDASVSEARKMSVLPLLVGEAIGFVLALIGQLNGALNVLGWSVVVVYLFLGIGLAYYYFARSAS
jgi:small-conductance mechanosensitive channel